MDLVRESLLLCFPLQPVGLPERALQSATPGRSPPGLRGHLFDSRTCTRSHPLVGLSFGSTAKRLVMDAERKEHRGAGAEAALPQGAGLPRGALPRRDGLLHGPTGPVRLRSCGHRPAVRREALPAPGLPGVLHTSPACGHKQICDIPTFLPIFSQGTTARFQDVGQTARLRVACQARQRACSHVNQREQWTPSRRAMSRQNARRSVPKIGQIVG